MIYIILQIYFLFKKKKVFYFFCGSENKWSNEYTVKKKFTDGDVANSIRKKIN